MSGRYDVETFVDFFAERLVQTQGDMLDPYDLATCVNGFDVVRRIVEAGKEIVARGCLAGTPSGDCRCSSCVMFRALALTIDENPPLQATPAPNKFEEPQAR